MSETFEQGLAARPFKEQFPELSDEEAERLNAVNDAIFTLYLTDMLTDSQLGSIRSKKFPKMVSKSLKEARAALDKAKGEA